MQAKRLVLAIVAAALLLCAVGWTAYAQRSRARRTAWEYQVYSFPNQYPDKDALKVMSDLGAQGWELVGVSEVSGTATCFFKRQK